MEQGTPARQPFAPRPTGASNIPQISSDDKAQPAPLNRPGTPWTTPFTFPTYDASNGMHAGVGGFIGAFSATESSNRTLTSKDLFPLSGLLAAANANARSSSSSMAPPPLPRISDPSAVPLPATSDADLQDGRTVVQAIGLLPSPKVAGARRSRPAKAPQPSDKGKGKRKRDEVSEDSDSSDESSAESGDDEGERPAKRANHGGRRPGAGNYSDPDVQKLLDLVEKELPIGQRGWKAVHKRYTKYAEKHKRHVRDCKALENKFKQLAGCRKPTGSGRRPGFITRAKAIDKKINEKAGTQNINDSEFEMDSEEEEGGMEAPDTQPSKKHTVVARSDRTEAPAPRRPRGGPASDLVQKIASALDPDAQRIRDEERANRSLHTTQIFSLNQQLRDAQNTIETLRADNLHLRERLNKVERIRDRLDTELNFERRLAGLGASSRGFEVPFDKALKYNPDVKRVKGKVRHDEIYPEGGRLTTWLTDGSSASDFGDSDKENILPSSDISRPDLRIGCSSLKPQHRKYGQSSSPTSSSPQFGEKPLPMASQPLSYLASAASSAASAGPSSLPHNA
ncbi:hypothetical protein CVT26_015609 [Gymnopilus dilepis]|uniref:DUF6818 domain-containing protein n=1 Tax=Gymnopilus dilepis TaxID=231916 RepID=A0A409XYL2_9AGAR|nr:hypothetical protein CVT26_015609 [Gymnopilus dilepis]